MIKVIIIIIIIIIILWLLLLLDYEKELYVCIKTRWWFTLNQTIGWKP